MISQALTLQEYKDGGGSPKLRQLIVGAVEAKLDLVANALAPDESGETSILINKPVLDSFDALQLCAQNRSKDAASVIRFLVKHGAQGRCARSGATALHTACEFDAEYACVELLLLFPNFLTATAYDGATALCTAVQCSSLKCAEHLIKSGVDVNQSAQRGTTPLLLASSLGLYEMCHLLLERGQAEPNMSDFGGQTPLLAAGARGFSKIVQLLLSHNAGLEVKVECCGGQTALIAAARGGHISVVNILLSYSADVDAADHMGRTSLYAAAGQGHTRIVKRLLECGASPEPLVDNDSSPIMIACLNGHLEVIKLLLRHGASLKAQDARGRTCFDLACAGGSYEVLNFLVNQGIRNASWAPALYVMKRNAICQQHYAWKQDES